MTEPAADILPGVLAEVAEVAGREAALDLALHMGGQPLHVPKPGHIAPEHPLVRAVGATAARIVADRFQGESLYIPIARRAQVLKLAEQGLPNGDIARRLGISRRSVERHRQATTVA